MITLSDFVHKYKLKNKATSNINVQQVLSSLSLNDIVIYLRDGSFSSDIGTVNLHPYGGSHWALYIHDCYCHSHGCAPPNKLSKFIKRN